MHATTIKVMRSPEELADAQNLVRGYLTEVNDTKNLENQLVKLGIDYQESNGGLYLIAYDGDKPVGCIAYRKLPQFPGCCEMKRFYVRPDYRNKSIGSALVTLLLSSAQSHYNSMKLHTTGDLQASIRMYKRHGFEEITRYNESQLPDSHFFQKSFKS